MEPRGKEYKGILDESQSDRNFETEKGRMENSVR